MSSIDSYTQHGEEFVQRTAYNDIEVTELDFLLFNQDHSNGGGDNLDETDDVGDITTELTGSAYARQTESMPQTLSFSRVDFDGDGNDEVRVEIDGVTFDLSDDTGEDFDAIGIIATFQSSVISSDGSATDHLIGVIGVPERNTNDYSGTVTFDNFGFDQD